MASGGKRKTTMAKLNRESRLRERRLEKQARKEARKNAPAEDLLDPGQAPTALSAEPDAADGGGDSATFARSDALGAGGGYRDDAA